jgi:hypothetical protein
MLISEEIFNRWCEKMNEEQTIPKSLIQAIKTLYEQKKLHNVEELEKLLKENKKEIDVED